MASAFIQFQIRIEEYDQFESAVNRYVSLTGESLKRVVRRESRGIIQTVYRFTAPWNQAQGENAVSRDMMRVFSPVTDAFFEEIEAITGGARQARVVLRRKDGTPYLVDWDYISANPAAMAAFHQGKRISRGRVQHAASLGSRTRDIGRWKEDSRMVVPHSAFARYLEIVKARVGAGKSGWLPAMNTLGIPADRFVTRHGSGNGKVMNNLHSDTDPHIIATNNVPYVARNARITDNAVRSRRKFLEAEIDKMLSRNAQIAGLA